MGAHVLQKLLRLARNLHFKVHKVLCYPPNRQHHSYASLGRGTGSTTCSTGSEVRCIKLFDDVFLFKAASSEMFLAVM